MKKKFLQLLFMLVSNNFFSFAETICINEKNQVQMSKPISFPFLDRALDFICTKEKKSQTIIYQSSAINGYKKNEENQKVKIEILSLEDSKAIDDNLLGDDFDKDYIKNIPYLIKDTKNSENTIELFEVKRNSSTEVLMYISNSSAPRIRFSCLDKDLKFEDNNNSSYINKILLSETCQEAIQEFNIPLSKEEIGKLFITKGYIN